MGETQTPREVWKFPIDDAIWYVWGDGGQTVKVPRGGVVVHANMHPHPAEGPCVWIEVDPEAPVEERRFAVVGTDFGIPPNATYLGSFFADVLVWHIYEIARVGGVS